MAGDLSVGAVFQVDAGDIKNHKNNYTTTCTNSKLLKYINTQGDWKNSLAHSQRIRIHKIKYNRKINSTEENKNTNKSETSTEETQSNNSKITIDMNAPKK